MEKNWRRSFLRAVAELGFMGTVISLIPSLVKLIIDICKNPKLLTPSFLENIMSDFFIFLGVYIILVVLLTLWYVTRKPERLAEVVSQDTKEPRQFFTLLEHAECIVKDQDAEVVSKYLLQKYKEIAHIVTTEKFVYSIDRGIFFDPKEHGTLQYAIVARGWKETVAGTSTLGEAVVRHIAKTEEIDMFVITIIQGGKNKSRVTFDTDIREIYPVCSDRLFEYLKESFKIGRIMRY